MTASQYTIEYLFKLAAFGAILAILKCGLSMLISYTGLFLSKLKIKALGKVLFHVADVLLVIVFLIGYLLLSYANRDGVIRVIDVLTILAFYCVWKYVFSCIFNFLDNILRRILYVSVQKPISYLHNLLVLALTRIIRMEKSKYK